MKGYYLIETEVRYVDDGLNKRAIPLSINNTILGQVIIQLKAKIVWRFVTIQVASILSTASGRRVLAQTTYDTVMGYTYLIECIKAEGSEICPTCEQECEANGFVHDGCEPCSFSIQIAFIFLALLLVFTI